MPCANNIVYGLVAAHIPSEVHNIPLLSSVKLRLLTAKFKILHSQYQTYEVKLIVRDLRTTIQEAGLAET